MFYIYINNKKKRVKESLHFLSDARGNTAAKDEEKAEVLNAFASVFKSQTGYSQGSQPQCWKTGKESRKNLLKSRRK